MFVLCVKLKKNTLRTLAKFYPVNGFIPSICAYKGKVVLVHPMKANRSRGITPLILNLDTR